MTLHREREPLFGKSQLKIKTPDLITDFEKPMENTLSYGSFQALVWAVALGTKMTTSAVFLYMSFAGATPDFWCKSTDNGTNVSVSSNDNDSGWSVWNKTDNDLYQTCVVNGSTCSAFRFDYSMKTIVNEWSLVCNKQWVSSTITSVQMAAITVGAAVSGQMADLWGRRKLCLILLLGQFVFCLTNAFSLDWIMFAVTRMAAGFCAAGYMIVNVSHVMEFTDVRWRSLAGSLPTFSLGTALMAMAAWLFRDWQYLGMSIAVFTVPFIVGWWFLPESVRWLLVHNRVEEAHSIVCRASRWSSRPPPDETFIRELALAERAKTSSKDTFTTLDLFRSRELIKKVGLLFSAWFTGGWLYYFLAFGAENLSGDLYLNIFILAIIEIPSCFLSAFLCNRLGRRWTCFLFYMTAGVCSAIVVALMLTETSALAVNGLVYTSKLALVGGRSAKHTFTSEMFPTAVRTIGFGWCNSAAMLGSVIAPQLVFLSTSHPTTPYVLATLMMVLSSLSFLLLPETNDRDLEDVLPSSSLPTSTCKSGSKTKDCHYVSVNPRCAQDTSI